MTPLTKSVSRRSLLPHRGRRLVITLEVGDMVTVRHERTRQSFTTTIAAIYDLAVRQAVNAARAEKAAAKRTKGQRR